METMQIAGIVVAALGLLELPVGLALVVPKAEPQSRPVLIAALAMGSLMSIGVGVALYLGFFG